MKMTFVSVLLARKRFPLVPVGWLLRDRFGAISKIGDVRAPVLIMAGALDVIVPPAMGRAIFAAARGPKEYWLAPDAGHNDLGDAGAFGVARGFVLQHWKAGS